MCTSTVEDALALPVHPAMAIVLEPVPRSGMAASLELVAAGHGPGGGGVEPEPVNSKEFGEPVPGLVILFGVPFAVIVLCTCAGVIDGLADRISAAAPTTCGVAIEVPLIVFVAVSLVFHDDVMFTPGAKMSVQVP